MHSLEQRAKQWGFGTALIMGHLESRGNLNLQHKLENRNKLSSFISTISHWSNFDILCGDRLMINLWFLGSSLQLLSQLSQDKPVIKVILHQIIYNLGMKCWPSVDNRWLVTKRLCQSIHRNSLKPHLSFLNNNCLSKL